MTTTESISARLPKEDIARLRDLGEQDDRSFSYMLAKAVRFFLEHHTDGPGPVPYLAPVPTPVFPFWEPSTKVSGLTTDHPSAQAAPADLFPEQESSPTPVNVEPQALAEDARLADLRSRLAASKSGREIDELTREINQIEGARTMALLNSLPGPDPTYVASREANET